MYRCDCTTLGFEDLEINVTLDELLASYDKKAGKLIASLGVGQVVFLGAWAITRVG